MITSVWVGPRDSLMDFFPFSPGVIWNYRGSNHRDANVWDLFEWFAVWKFALFWVGNITIPFSPFLKPKQIKKQFQTRWRKNPAQKLPRNFAQKTPKNRLWALTFPFHQRKQKIGRKYAAVKRRKVFAKAATWNQAFVPAKTVNACQTLEGLMFPRTPNDFHWAPYHVLVSWFLGLFLGVGDQEQKKHSNIFLGLPMTISQMDVGLSSNLPGEKSNSKWMFHKFGGKFP